MEHQDIRYEVAERVRTLTLHWPDKLNAFDRADADDGVRAIIGTSGEPFETDATHREHLHRAAERAALRQS